MTSSKHGEGKTVESVMSKRLITIDLHNSVADAAKIMVDNKISSVLVTRNGGIIGIATERDIVQAAARNIPLDGITIGSLMSKPLVSIPINAKIEELAAAMVKNRIRHLLVTDSNGKDIVGITSVTDIARYLKQSPETRQAGSLIEAIYPGEYPTEGEVEKLFW
jgi:CBS domain-containing protein